MENVILREKATLDLEYGAIPGPRNHVAHELYGPVTDTSCDVWVPTQAQTGRAAAAEAAGLDSDQVQIHTTYLGGASGAGQKRISLPRR